MIEVLTGGREATVSPSAPSWAWVAVATGATGGRRPRSPWQRCHREGARIEVRDAERADVHGPDPVDNLVEPNVVADEGTAEKQHVLMPRHTAVRADPSDLDVTEVVETRKAPGQPARRRPIVRGGGGVIECLVRPVLVVFAPKTAEATSGRRRSAPAGEWFPL